MESRLASMGGALSRAIDTQKLAPELINATLSKMGNMPAAPAAPVIDTASQQAILSSANAEMGKGTRVDAVV